MPMGAGAGCHEDTHLRRRDPTVLALHGEALGGREGRGISGGPGGDPCLRPPPQGREATLSLPELPLASRGWAPWPPCAPGGAVAPYLVGREQDGAQGEARVVGDGGPLRR